jgi:hypothetical protein
MKMGVEAAVRVARSLEHRGAVLVGLRGRHVTHLVQLRLRLEAGAGQSWLEVTVPLHRSRLAALHHCLALRGSGGLLGRHHSKVAKEKFGD